MLVSDVRRAVCSSSISGDTPEWRYPGSHIRAPFSGSGQIATCMHPASKVSINLFLLFCLPLARLEFEFWKREHSHSCEQLLHRHLSFSPDYPGHPPGAARQRHRVLVCPIGHAHSTHHRPCHRLQAQSIPVAGAVVIAYRWVPLPEPSPSSLFGTSCELLLPNTKKNTWCLECRGHHNECDIISPAAHPLFSSTNVV
jgi:hypothetical protein